MKTEFRRLDDGRWYWRVASGNRVAASINATRGEAREAFRAGKELVEPTEPESAVPHTLTALKRLAKAEVENTGVKHSTALEIVAERYGFMDFDDARKRLPP